MFDPKISAVKATAIILAGMFTAPAPIQAQTFIVPDGCEAFLTVQSRGCNVAHYWTCKGEEDGVFWRVSIDEDGPYTLNQSDANYRWLQSFSLRRDNQTRLLSEADPASLDQLFETGRDDMDFTLEETENGVTFETRYAGYDAVSGVTIEIDGEELMLTEFAYEFEAESGTVRVEGNQFLSQTRRLFFSGIDTVSFGDGQSFQTDGSPREFLEPGEDGFLTMLPAYECGDTMSGWSLPPEPRG